MKNETPISQDIQRSQSLPLIKLLGLAMVAWGVLGHGWFGMMGAAWVVWLVLVLLILLDASACESRPAAWNQATTMLGRIMGPGMMPFYGALCLLLAVGPSYVRQMPVFTLPTKGSNVPSQVNKSSAFTPNASFAPKPASLNTPAFSSSPSRGFKRPNITQGPTAPPAKPQAPGSSPSTVAPPAPKPASPTPALVPPSTPSKPAPIQPSGSARPSPGVTQ